APLLPRRADGGDVEPFPQSREQLLPGQAMLRKPIVGRAEAEVARLQGHHPRGVVQFGWELSDLVERRLRAAHLAADDVLKHRSVRKPANEPASSRGSNTRKHTGRSNPPVTGDRPTRSVREYAVGRRSADRPRTTRRSSSLALSTRGSKRAAQRT